MEPVGSQDRSPGAFHHLDGVHAVCVQFNEKRKIGGCQISGSLAVPSIALKLGIVSITVDVSWSNRIVVKGKGGDQMSAEPMYQEGRSEARHKALAANLDELLAMIDSLYGRDNIEDLSDVEAVREEALHQVDREFKNPNSIGWDMVDVIKADRGFGR